MSKDILVGDIFCEREEGEVLAEFIITESRMMKDEKVFNLGGSQRFYTQDFILNKYEYVRSLDSHNKFKPVEENDSDLPF